MLGSDAEMKKTALIVVGVAVGGWAVAALVVGSASLDLFGGHTGLAISPACLPATVAHSASIPGAGVDVSPAPGTGTANPNTQISFLGTGAAQVREVSAVGSQSGGHPGRVVGYSQGDGASFVPERPFDPGERVTVRAAIGAGRSGSISGGPGAGGPTPGGPRPIAFSFRVDTPYPTAHVPEFPAPPAAPADSQSFYTLPGIQAPILTVTTADRDPAAGDIFTTNGPGPGQYGPLIYTPTGRLVWFDRPAGGATAEDLNVQTYDGKPALTWWRGKVLSLGFGQGEDLVMNSEYRTVATVRGGNGLQADLHDFQLAPRGVAYITAYNPIRCDLAPAKGSADGAIVDTAVQEIDMRTGLVRWEWHSLDHVGIAESETEAPAAATPWDWFHINSIDVEGAGGDSPANLLISARSTWAEYQLEGGSGRIMWRLGGNNSSFKMGRGTVTAWQHDGRMLPGGEVTLFDDGANPPIHSRSRAVVIALDFKRREARLVRAYVHPDPPLLAASQGNMQTTAAGNAVVGYGGVPEISEYAPDGSLLLDAHLSYDMTFYRAFRYPWNGRPQSPPELFASANNTGEETIVHASWNGATDVAGWRVLAGEKPGSLTVKATIPAEGFESATTLPKKYAWAAVQALDSAGRTIGTSHTVAVSGFYASLSGGGTSK
jgi:Arylsulfotransferase (ASST)